MIHHQSPKRTAEVEWFGVDFSALLADGETISGAQVTASTVAAGSGGTAFAAVGGSAVSGGVVRQLWGGGAPGATYQLDVQVTTSTGQVLIESLQVSITT